MNRVCLLNESFPSRPTCRPSCLLSLRICLQQQQLQAQHLSHAAHGPPVQLPPHPSGLQPPGMPPVTGVSSGLLALGTLGSQAHLPVKDEKNHHDLEHRGEEHSLPNKQPAAPTVKSKRKSTFKFSFTYGMIIKLSVPYRLLKVALQNHMFCFVHERNVVFKK